MILFSKSIKSKTHKMILNQIKSFWKKGLIMIWFYYFSYLAISEKKKFFFVLGLVHGTTFLHKLGQKLKIFRGFSKFFLWAPGFQWKLLILIESPNIPSSAAISDDFWRFFLIFPVFFTTNASLSECVTMIVPVVSNLVWIPVAALLHRF